MARGKAAAAAESAKKRKEVKEEVDEQDEKEADEGGEEDDKENQQPEEENCEDEQEEEDEEEEAAGSQGKRKNAASDSSPNKKAKASDAHSVVLAYMQRMNRPYSAINVADNMRGALSKSATVKVLDELTNDGKVSAKEYGKSKLYFAAQSNAGVTPEDIAKVDRQIAEVTEQLNKARAAVASMQSELNSVTGEPDDDSLDAQLAELEKSVPAAEKKLAALKEGKDALPAAEVDALQRQFNSYLAEWKKRRKGCRELIGVIAENAAKSWKEKNFCEDQGIETDEAVKVKLDEWQTLFRVVKPLPKEVKGKGKKK